jgi:hypothetical protein
MKGMHINMIHHVNCCSQIGLVSHLWTYSCISTSLCCEQVSYLDKQLVRINDLAALPTFQVRLCHPKLCEFWKRMNSVSPLLTWVHRKKKYTIKKNAIINVSGIK